MSELKAALAAIMSVKFHEPIAASEQHRISAFLERVAHELTNKEQLLAEREEKVSQREANATVREDTIASQVKTLDSIGRLREVMAVPRKRMLSGWGMGSMGRKRG